MGVLRNGASTWLRIMVSACRLSHIKGFRAGLARIVGEANAASFYTLWTPLCAAIEAYMASDDYPFQVDYTAGEEQDVELA